MADDRLSNTQRWKDRANSEVLEAAIAKYLERLTSGERLDRFEILAENPSIGDKILEALQEFVDLNPQGDDAPLGTLGDYTLRRQIGRGGMGVVYEAWQGSLDRQVALKVLPAGIAADNKAFMRFMREAKTAAQLNHQNVVSVFGMGVEQNTPYYSMEYVEGETLAQVLARIKEVDDQAETPFGKKGELGFYSNLASAFADVADGLQHAHSKGVIHRDIKPSNLILDTEGRLRILDFGLARFEGQESLTVSGDLMGTVLYMSPEQAMAKRILVDHRTDIYSLGASMYEMLTLRPPFQGKSHQDTLSSIIFVDPEPPRKRNSRIPRDLQTLVLKCLHKDPKDRYGTTEALAQDLRRFARGDPIEARPQSAWELLWKRLWRKKRRLVAAAFTCVFAILVSLLVHHDAKTREQKNRDFYKTTVIQAALILERGELLTLRESGNLDLVDPGISEDTKYVLAGFLSRDKEREHDQLLDPLDKAADIVPERPEAPYYKARALMLLNRPREARDAVDQTLRRDRDFVPARLLKAAILENLKDPEGAKRERDRARDCPPGSWQSEWIRAHEALEDLRWDEAADAFRDLQEIDGAGRPIYLGAAIGIYLKRARARLRGGDYHGAIRDLVVATYLWPGVLEPALLLGRAYRLAGEEEEAEKCLREIHGKISSEGESALWIHLLYDSLGDHARALEWATEIHDDFYRELMKASTLEEQGRLGEAEAAALAAVSRKDSPVGYLVLGRVFESKGARLQAENAFRQAIKLDPAFVPAHMRLGHFMFKGLKREEGLAELRLAIELDPDYAYTYTWLAGALHGIRRYDEAKAVLLEAIRRRPEVAFNLTCLGIVYMDMEHYEDAIRSHENALKVRPDYAFGHSNLARVHLRQGRLNKAIAGFRRAIELEPSFKEPYEVLGRSLRKETKPGGEEELRALADLLEEQIESREDHPRLLGAIELLVLTCLRLEDFPRALRFARLGCERAFPENPDLWRLLAKVQFASGDVSGAVVTGEEGLRLPRADQYLLGDVERYRKQLTPDLASYRSIDAALESLDREVLVPQGARWRYFPGRRDPSPAIEWTGIDFNHDAWSEEPSGFGFGDGDDATVLEDMRNSYSTLYIRHVFSVPDPGRYERLRLSVRVDDGLVAYLNGTEVARLGVDPKEPWFSSDRVAGRPALEYPPDPLLIQEFLLDREILRLGENVLALQGFNYSLDSSDFSLIPVLTAELEPDPERDRGLLEAFRGAAKGPDVRKRILYLEGRILERSGSHREAALRFGELLALDGGKTDPHLCYARCLVDAGDAREAERHLRGVLEEGTLNDRELWDLWLVIAFRDLERSPADMLTDFPAAKLQAPAEEQAAMRSHRADLRWLLERLDSREPIRINCGGGDYTDPSGAIWSRDRLCHRGRPEDEQSEPRNSEPLLGEVAGTDCDRLYRQHRVFHGAYVRPMAYRVPLPRGKYRVNLHFAEIWFKVPGRGVLDVLAEGTRVLKDYEPLAEAGFAAADHREFEVMVEDGMLEIEFVPRSESAEVSAIGIRPVNTDG